VCAGYETLLPGVYDDVLSFSGGNAGKIYVPQSRDLWKWTIPV